MEARTCSSFGSVNGRNRVEKQRKMKMNNDNEKPKKIYTGQQHACHSTVVVFSTTLNQQLPFA